MSYDGHDTGDNTRASCTCHGSSNDEHFGGGRNGAEKAAKLKYGKKA